MVEESKKLTTQIPPLDEERYYNYEDNVCEEPESLTSEPPQEAPPESQLTEEEIQTSHYDFENNICTAEPLNHSTQPDEDDKFIFKKEEPKIVVREEDKRKSVENAATRFSPDAETITAAINGRAMSLHPAANILSQPVMTGAVVYSAPSFPIFSVVPILILSAIDFANADSGLRSEMPRKYSNSDPSEKVVEPISLSSSPFPAEWVVAEAISPQPLENSDRIPLAIRQFPENFSSPVKNNATLSNSLPASSLYSSLSFAQSRQERLERGFEDLPSYSSRIAAPVFAVGLLEGVAEHPTPRTVSPFSNNAASPGPFLMSERLEYGDLGQPLTSVLHPAFLPPETTRMPIVPLARSTISSETEKVLASAEPQSSQDNRDHHSGEQGNRERDESYSEELAKIQEIG